MKRATVLGLILVLFSGVGFADQGNIGVFADPQGLNCNLPDVVPGIAYYYVVHLYTTGSSASQYIAAKPACMTATWLADNNPFAVTIGNSQTGVSVGYGGCRVGPIHIQTMLYFASGTTPACCLYPVKCDPLGINGCAGGRLDTVDCGFRPALATGQVSVVNANSTCHCGTPTEETTWGRVKSLYGE